MKTLSDLKNDEALSTSVEPSKATRSRKTADNFETIKVHSEPSPPPPELSSNIPIIIVFGLVGVGKTSFINKATGSDGPTGDADNYVPCTDSCSMATGKVNGVEVSFVDTPGFGNPARTDEANLSHIIQWFSKNVGTTKKITAAMYFQSVMSKAGKSLDNTQRGPLNCFISFVGSGFSKNIGLVSTHWDRVKIAAGSFQEENLMKGLWKTRLAKGARKFRGDNGQRRNYQMIKDLLKLKPDLIQVQRDLEAGQAILQRLQITNGSDRIPGAFNSIDEESLLETRHGAVNTDGVDSEDDDTDEDSLSHQTLDFVKNHWKMILIAAAVATVGGLGLYWWHVSSVNAAVLAARAAQPVVQVNAPEPTFWGKWFRDTTFWPVVGATVGGLIWWLRPICFAIL